MVATQLDQLPDLCLRKIFAFLNLRDRAKCRAVCRLFKFHADETTVDQLVVKGVSYDILYDYSFPCGEYFDTCSVWYLTDREIDFRNSISEIGFSSMRSPLKLNQRLKFLHVHLSYVPNFDFKLFDDLNQLVHLELRIEGLGNATKTLALPNLKVFDVENYSFTYVLNTPKLEVLSCSQIERTLVEYPETIKQLECKYHADQVAKFKNLEVFTYPEGNYQLSPISLSDWEHLKELNLRMVPSGYHWIQNDQFVSWVVSIMRQRADLKRDELKLYLDDVLLVDEKQLHWTVTSSEDLMLKNHQHLRRDTYPDVRKIQFEHLVKLGVELSTEFFRRFPAIQKLTADGPVDSHSFEWFLENATALHDLILRGTLLDQTFMNRLPNIASRLRTLEVCSGGYRLINDFNFILRLDKLFIFQTDHQFDSLELVAQAYRQLKELARVEFRAGNETVIILREETARTRKVSKDEYMFRIYSEYGSQKLYRNDIKWAELVALYDQRRAELAGAPVEAKVKRAQLK